MYTIKKKTSRKEDFMSLYLYVYNYSPHEKDLCCMEFRQIFHSDMQSKYYLSQQYFDYTRSVFIKGRLNVIYHSSCFKDIVEYLHQEQLCYFHFKVIYLKNDITHVSYQESLDKCKQIALPINGSVNMQNPEIIFAITQIEDEWYFGTYDDKKVWKLRYDKPHSYSHSLNTRDARTLVNIAVGNNLFQKIVDPCCGIGTVVLEALSMGIDIAGFDINRYVAYQARLNLEYFGYDPLIIQKRDMHTIDQRYDVTIMDIPYGVYSPFTYEEQVSLLKSARRLSYRLLLVSHIDMNQELESLGYQIIDQATILKGKFLRYITLCELIRKE